MILDADDVLAPGCLKRAMSIMDEHPGIAFCHGGERRISSDGVMFAGGPDAQLDAKWRITSGMDFIRRLCSRGYNVVGNPTAVRRTRIQKSIGHYDPDLIYATDMNMWLRLATLGDVAETPVVQGIRRLHAGQMSQPYRDAPVTDLVEHLNNFEHFFRHEGALLPTAREERRRVTRRLAFNGLYMAATLVLSRRLKQSMPCIHFSLRAYAALLGQYLRPALPSGARPSAADADAV